MISCGAVQHTDPDFDLNYPALTTSHTSRLLYRNTAAEAVLGRIPQCDNNNNNNNMRCCCTAAPLQIWLDVTSQTGQTGRVTFCYPEFKYQITALCVYPVPTHVSGYWCMFAAGCITRAWTVVCGVGASHAASTAVAWVGRHSKYKQQYRKQFCP